MTNESDIPAIVGGGTKKVLYTLQTVKRIGLKNSAKALSAKNACKACGLGMGGQRGGMINELDEFPSVCNKSVQAQSTDIQPPIPQEIFQHTLDDLRELTSFELEHLGRLNTPIYKAADADTFEPVSWDFALAHAAQKFRQTPPERSFFYSSGRSSNEAGFIFQLLARAYGTNNVNNCSYYCHQATGVALNNTIGTSTATVELCDLAGCDLIFVIGANPASNHPRLLHQLIKCRERGGHIVVINPAKEPGLVRFAAPKMWRSMLAGGSYVASEYLQPHIGSDIALFKGIAKAVIALNGEDTFFIDGHTNNYPEFLADIEKTTWEAIESASGISKTKIEHIAAMYSKAKNVIFAWGMGMTHHRHGVQNIEYIVNLALLRGMVGKKNSGLLPLRGHSNVQGIGSVGVKPKLPLAVLEKLQTRLQVNEPSEKGLDTLSCLQSAFDGNIDCALLMGGNLYEATPQTHWARQALDRVNFKLYLTTTLNKGHIHGVDASEALILPVTARDEEKSPTTQESMFNYVRLSEGGIERLDNTRPETEILCTLAQAILGDDRLFKPLLSHQKVREAIADIVPGMAALKYMESDNSEFHIKGRILHKPEFNTRDSKATFSVHPLPSRLTHKPFMLMTTRSEGQFNSIIYEQHDSYRGIPERWSVGINPQDMKKLKLKKGDKVTLQSSSGRMLGVSVYPFDIKPGNLLAYYPEANALTDLTVDPLSKTPAFKSVGVELLTT